MDISYDERVSQIAQQKLDEYAKCDCCERHRKNKPTKFEPWIEATPILKKDKGCQCDCRHNARLVCRCHIDYKQTTPCDVNLVTCGMIIIEDEMTSFELQTYLCDMMPLSYDQDEPDIVSKL